MQSKINDQRKVVSSDLQDALKEIEQACEALRWRLSHFKDAPLPRRLKTDVGTLTRLTSDVSRLYGRLEAMDDFGVFTGDAPSPRTNAEALNVATISGAGPMEKTYDVIQLPGDTPITKIVEIPGRDGEYPTFEEAKSAAIEHLEEALEISELEIDFLRIADTPERYFGTEDATVPEADGNVQFVCKDAYLPDPQIQDKPLDWFLGKTVKLRFSIPGRPENGEFMWVAVTSIRGEELVGTLTNEPLFADQTCGDEIIFRREDILIVQEDWVTA